MSDQTIFNEVKTAEPSAPTESGQDLLSQIVDDNGRPKYADVPTALAALKHAQEYIPQLHSKLDTQQSQLSQYEKEILQRDTVSDFVEKVRSSSTGTPPPVVETPTPTGLDADAAAKLIEQIVSERELGQVKKTNQKAVIEALQEKFGDKAEEVYTKKASDLGLSLDQFNSLSGTSPKAVLEYFGTASTKTSVDVSTGTVNLEGVRQDTPMEWGNHTKSVLSGSTAKDVRAESNRVKDLVAKVHEAGGSIEALTDPKEYFKTFANRNSQ